MFQSPPAHTRELLNTFGPSQIWKGTHKHQHFEIVYHQLVSETATPWYTYAMFSENWTVSVKPVWK